MNLNTTIWSIFYYFKVHYMSVFCKGIQVKENICLIYKNNLNNDIEIDEIDICNVFLYIYLKHSYRQIPL